MCWFLFGPENCVSCVGLGEGGGEAPQVKQLFEDEIIVWLYHCEAVWPTEAQPSSTTGCVISSLRPPPCAKTFLRVWLRSLCR